MDPFDMDSKNGIAGLARGNVKQCQPVASEATGGLRLPAGIRVHHRGSRGTRGTRQRRARRLSRAGPMLAAGSDPGQTGAMAVHHWDRTLSTAEGLEGGADPVRRSDEALVGR